MDLTTNYSLKKPSGADVVNIDDFNYNADILDREIKSIRTKLDGLNLTASNVKMSNGTTVEESVSANKTSIQLALEKSEQAFQRGDEVKTKLVDKLISEGLQVSTNNTFEELIGNIALGRKFASGIGVTSSSNKAFTYLSGGTSPTSAYLEISGFNFTPSIIIVDSFLDNVYNTSIYMAKKEPSELYGNGCVKTFENNTNVTTKMSKNYVINSAICSDGVYHIPIGCGIRKSVNWIAFE